MFYIYILLFYWIVEGCKIEISEELESKLNTIFALVLAIFIIVFWFFVMPIS